MNRLTDKDRKFGPFTLARWWKQFSIEFDTGDQDEEIRWRNHIMICAFGWALRIALPNLIPPYRERVEAHWDAETVKRLGRNHYFKTDARRFGISLSDMGNGYDFLQIHYGRNTHDSSTDKHWGKHLPWKQWRHVRRSLYTPSGEHFYTEPQQIRGIESHREVWDEEAKCPVSHFMMEDFDGTKIVVTCRIEEREWHRGEGWFRWLRHFYRPKIHRSLDLQFSKEMGPEKGSWKGGTLGHGTEMVEGDTPESAFRRYCNKEQNARHGRKYKIRFIGPCPAPHPKETGK
jgi:hypothetical protein